MNIDEVTLKVLQRLYYAFILTVPQLHVHSYIKGSTPIFLHLQS